MKRLLLSCWVALVLPTQAADLTLRYAAPAPDTLASATTTPITRQRLTPLFIVVIPLVSTLCLQQ
jgi:hypothetical protein